MRDKATYFRSATGRITGDGMVEDRYDEDAMSPHCQAATAAIQPAPWQSAWAVRDVSRGRGAE